MRADELDGMSPADFGALVSEWRAEQRRLDYRAGVIAVLVRGGGCHPADFFPSLDVMRPPPPSEEELERKLIGLTEQRKA